MTAHANERAPQTAPPSSTRAPGERRWARRAFTILSWLLLVAIPIQVFFAGAGVMVDASWWTYHRNFVHVFELFPVLMLILAFVARLPAMLKWMSLAGFVLIWLQYALVSVRPSLPAAFHAVNALLLFGLSLEIARRSRWPA